jgi:hypothetical protein
MIISFEDIRVQNVTCFRCIRAPDVTHYPARGKTYFYVKIPNLVGNGISVVTFCSQSNELSRAHSVIAEHYNNVSIVCSRGAKRS